MREEFELTNPVADVSMIRPSLTELLVLFVLDVEELVIDIE